MSYPKELLPKIGYKKIEENRLNSHSIVRKIKKPMSQFIVNGEIHSSILEHLTYPNPNTEIFSYSVYLFGEYTERHCKFKVTDKTLEEDWDFISELPEDVPYDIDDSWNPVFIELSNLNMSNHLVKSQIATPKKIQLHVKHSPTISNFWHFQFYFWNEAEKNYIKKSKSAWKGNFATDFLESILLKAIQIYSPNYVLEESLYK